MENKNFQCYGYLLNCPGEMVISVNERITEKNEIHWSNFNVGDPFCTKNNDYYCARVDHVMKQIMFLTEEDYKKFERRYKNNKPDMREKVREYITELDGEIDRLESDLEKQMTYSVEACKVAATESRLNTIIEVKNDLLGRLKEVI